VGYPGFSPVGTVSSFPKTEEAARGGLFFFLTLYYQNTKFGDKQRQLSWGSLAGKSWGIMGHYFGFLHRPLTNLGGGERSEASGAEARFVLRRFRHE
jgi:hypothetical protein